MAGRRPKDQVDADISAAEPAGQREDGPPSPRLAALSPHGLGLGIFLIKSLFYTRCIQESTPDHKNQQLLGATVTLLTLRNFVYDMKDLSDAYPDVCRATFVAWLGHIGVRT